MDILVRDRGTHDHAAPPGEARILGLVAGVVVLGMLFLFGAFDRSDRMQVAANAPGIAVQKAPEPLLPDPLLP